MSDRDAPSATSASSPSPPDVLDAVALGRLRELDPDNKSGLVLRVLRAFDGSARRLSAQLDEAREKGDIGSIRHVVHTFKSSAACIGALGLSRRCVDIETLIRNDATQPLDSVLDEMANELAIVLKALQPMLGPTP